MNNSTKRGEQRREETCCPAFLHRLILSGKRAYVIENEPVKRFCIFSFPQWIWQWVSFKMWPFHTHKEHIKHTLCSRKVLTEVRFMCWGLDFQIESNAVSKIFVIYTANVLAWIPIWLLKIGKIWTFDISLETCSIHQPGVPFLSPLSFWETTLLLP